MTIANNDAMRAYWSGEPGRFWLSRIDTIDAMLQPFGEALVAALRPQPGERVLDVGCGHGNDTIELARRVAPNGSAVGVDISSVLVEDAQARAAADGMGNTTFFNGDAQVDELPGPFDAVYSRFGVMFFADPIAAFHNIRRACQPSARLAFMCWQGPEKNPASVIVANTLRELFELPAPPAPDSPGPGAFARVERAREVVEGGGWVDAAIEPFTTTPSFGASDVVQTLVDIGPARVAYAQATPEVQAKAVDMVMGAIAPFAVGDRYEFPQAAWIVTARAPATR